MAVADFADDFIIDFGYLAVFCADLKSLWTLHDTLRERPITISMYHRLEEVSIVK